ncbi:hypothetical protein YC2023_117780 [Brassica napus]
MKCCRQYRGNSDRRQRLFPRDFLGIFKILNGSLTAIIYPRIFVGVFRGILLPRYFIGIFRGNSEETQILGFFGISSEIRRNIPRISFSVRMSVRITMFSCSDYNRKALTKYLHNIREYLIDIMRDTSESRTSWSRHVSTHAKRSVSLSLRRSGLRSGVLCLGLSISGPKAQKSPL